MGLRRFLRKRKERMLEDAARLTAARRAAVVEVEYAGLAVSLTGPHMVPLMKQAFLDGCYELPEISAVSALVRVGDKVLEVGTGIGVVTAVMARKVGPTGCVRSFEANEALIAAAHALFARNKIENVTVENAILVPSAEHGTRTFYIGDFYTESALDATGQGARPHAVPTRPIQPIIDELRPDVFVCDIEGAEGELIPALDASSLRVAVIEFHPKKLARRDVAAIFDNLLRHGLYPSIEYSEANVVAFERV